MWLREAVRVRAKRTMVGTILALAACWLAAACGSSGGSSCFSPANGPADPSCAGFDLGLSCQVDLAPWYSCTCTKGSGTTQTWVCAPVGATGAGGSGGATGTGGGGGGMGDAGAD
jgi:hypothetical protein